MADTNEAWTLAEDEGVAWLKTTLDDYDELTIEAGSNVQRLDTINKMLFSIGSDLSPSLMQTHQHQGGANTWHTQSALIAIFETKELAREIATKIMLSVPMTPATYLKRLYMTDHPIITEQQVQKENTTIDVWGWFLRINFGAVYQAAI
jgi:hypothetical protein